MEIIGNGHLADIVKRSFAMVDVAGDYTIIAIDTPINDDFSVNLEDIESAFAVARQNKNLVILMSPIPVQALKAFRKILGRNFVYNPENLRLAGGTELYLLADRQIVGCSKKLKPEMEKFYSWYTRELLFMSLESAAMVKHATNGFLAISIGYANKIAKNCKDVGADYDDVLKGLRSDNRIGQSAYLEPGQPSKHLMRDLKILENL